MSGIILSESRIYREHRHIGIVEAIESDLLAVRRPPERLITRRAAENFLIIHPGRVSVENQLRTIKGQTRLNSRGNIHHIKVIVAGKCQFCRIRRIGKVGRTLRLDREIRITRRSLDTLTFLTRTDIHSKRRAVCKRAIIRERRLPVADPLPRTRDRIELLSHGSHRQTHQNRY